LFLEETIEDQIQERTVPSLLDAPPSNAVTAKENLHANKQRTVGRAKGRWKGSVSIAAATRHAELDVRTGRGINSPPSNRCVNEWQRVPQGHGRGKGQIRDGLERDSSNDSRHTGGSIHEGGTFLFSQGQLLPRGDTLQARCFGCQRGESCDSGTHKHCHTARLVQDRHPRGTAPYTSTSQKHLYQLDVSDASGTTWST